MKLLSRLAYEKAVNYIKQNARPIDKALYAYHFEKGSMAAFLTELVAFQNADGGFGHALEPDLRLVDSSVIATTVAFQHFLSFELPGDHEMVRQACAHLLTTYDAQHVNWPIIPANIDDAPHAPWWNYDSNVMSKNPVNPRAEIVRYLHAYPEHFPTPMRNTVTQSVIDYLFSQPDDMDMFDLYCYIHLWKSEGLPKVTRSRIFDRLQQVVNNTVQRRPEDWKDYGLNPLSVASAPDSPFMNDMLREAVDQNLDFMIDAQNADGCWQPNWSWGEQWPAAWEQAKTEWSGLITLGNLRTLKAFGRIDI